MDFTELTDRIEARLRKPLPGRSAQLKMSSMKRIRELMRFSPAVNPKMSGVLLLLYPLQGRIGLVLMQRPEYGGVHSGQISLPGGKYEDGDRDLEFTALREAREEIGIDPDSVTIIGRLSEMYIPPSNFMVAPFVGFQSTRPAFTADPKEVAGIIEIGLDDLMDQGNRQMKTMKLAMGLTLKVPAYMIDGAVIWGATAMILSEFREIVKEAGW